MSEGSKNYQGGKKYGELRKQQELSLDEVNKLYLEDDDYQDEDDYPELKETLEKYKKQFMEYDLDNSGDIDLMELKMMMEKLEQAKTHLELKKMISEVDRENRGAISYNDFLFMMLGKKSSVLKLILKFEEAMKEKQRPTGVAPKRDLSSLP
ncbi:allograft inflammatory factor 1-like [Hydractinia symbiolongicarpus]|uniref:allograft inflammatory factor 1-like n=1 Tax=Hydractinia symbiolongicarpus TaxID=13093 RepID=UPI00254AE420|nr:allograft inflammatory factor 1-like [Hydractinia symbiolongicarpus]